ncbi:MAG: DUF624 domain-containing protein [Ruminococcus sp.]|nr:DUF624 domain-containing protein [Ruminococcus sp.]
MGIFFKDYESSGPGIAKNGPKKKGIALFFDIFLRKFWVLFGLNMIYFIFFLPLVLAFAALSFMKDYNALLAVITVCMIVFAVMIGPATAGLTKVLRCFILEKHTFIFRDFFKAFKTNFKKAVAIGMIDVLVMMSVFAAYNVYPGLAIQAGTKLLYVPMVLTFSLGLVVVMMNYYIFLMLIATDLSLKDLIKNSFALAFLGMKKNLISFVISTVVLVLMGLLLLYAPPLFMLIAPFLPAAQLCFIICFNSYPVIQTYVINPYYTSIGQVNPELTGGFDDIEEEAVFQDMGGKEKPVEKRKKGKGRHIS